jgi:error-prone DNA polymerase
MLRPGLDPKILRSSDLKTARDNSVVEVAGMVVARQRPETANGIVFMLLEDERGTVNLIVPPPVYDRHRALVRAAPLLGAKGKLERREGAINVIVTKVWALERTEKTPSPTRPRRAAQVPSVSGHNTSLSGSPFDARMRPPSSRAQREHAVAELRAVAPAGHSFGRRG